MHLDVTITLTAIAALAAFYMAWNIGANNVAVAMGTSVGSGALTLAGALVVAGCCEFGGAMLVGGSVTKTIETGILRAPAFAGDPNGYAIGMACSLLSAALWIHIATYRGWPISATHSIVGALVGFALAARGTASVNWESLRFIGLSWLIAPCLGALLAFGLFRLLQWRILDSNEPLRTLRWFGPLMVALTFFVLVAATLSAGALPVTLHIDFGTALLLGGLFAFVMAVGSVPLFAALTQNAENLTSHAVLARTERVFGALQVMTACFVAFAHGSNDVSKAVGPMAGVLAAFRDGAATPATGLAVPSSVMLLGAVGIVVGLATYGYKVIGTVGSGITELTPSRGFAAEFATATIILVASFLGLPVSTTHTLVGAIIGVGFARSIGAINGQVLRGILVAWLVTVPFTATFAAILYRLIRALV